MSWAIAKIGDVCEVVSGATPKTTNPSYWEGDVPWVTPKDLSELASKVLLDTPRKITGADLNSCSARMLPADSVLFSSRVPIGLVAINAIPVCTNQGFKSMVPREGHIFSGYLFWWLTIHRDQLQNLGRGANFKEVSKQIVEDIQIPLSPNRSGLRRFWMRRTPCEPSAASPWPSSTGSCNRPFLSCLVILLPIRRDGPYGTGPMFIHSCAHLKP
ncbi:MAG: hypothetical protein C1943_01810 [Halochromatium sp.]|nr:hypothetical protein [Halochromatium sp.]